MGPWTVSELTWEGRKYPHRVTVFESEKRFGLIGRVTTHYRRKKQ